MVNSLPVVIGFAMIELLHVCLSRITEPQTFFLCLCTESISTNINCIFISRENYALVCFY